MTHAREGGVDQVRALIQETTADATGPGYAIERALCALAASRVDGASSGAMRERALRELVEEDVDSEVIASIFRTAQSEPISGPVPAAPDRGFDRAVVDGRRHELRSGATVISLKSRHVVRRILYVLAARPGRAHSKEEIASAIWSAAYRKFVHDNALKVNIRNLRTLLQGTPLSIEREEDGYSLSVPDGFAFVPSKDG